LFQNKKIKKKSILILALIITGILLGYGLVIYVHTSIKDFKSQNLGFAVNSTGVSEQFQERLVSAQTPLIKSLQDFKKENNQTILWLGASQLYTVTNPDLTPHTAVFYANKKAQNDNFRFIQYATANANLNELEIILQQFINHNAIPDYLVLGMVYDDLREIGIRAEIKRLAASNQTSTTNQTTNKDTTLKTSEKNLNQAVENRLKNLDYYITDLLQKNFSPYTDRSKIKAYFQSLLLRTISQIGVFIKGRPQVKVPENIQLWNMHALDRILKTANNNNIKLLIYKAPHRPGEEKFYHVRSEYDLFFKSLEKTLINKKIHYIDLERLVPKTLWGGETQLGLADIFHFQEEAHQLLGEKILAEIEKMNKNKNGI